MSHSAATSSGIIQVKEGHETPLPILSEINDEMPDLCEPIDDVVACVAVFKMIKQMIHQMAKCPKGAWSDFTKNDSSKVLRASYNLYGQLMGMYSNQCFVLRVTNQGFTNIRVELFEPHPLPLSETVPGPISQVIRNDRANWWLAADKGVVVMRSMCQTVLAELLLSRDVKAEEQQPPPPQQRAAVPHAVASPVKDPSCLHLILRMRAANIVSEQDTDTGSTMKTNNTIDD